MNFDLLALILLADVVMFIIFLLIIGILKYIASNSDDD